MHIENYRCLVNFNYRPARKQLILGGNGSGKSTFIDALTALRQFAVVGAKAGEAFPLSSRTRWLDLVNQCFELEAELDGRQYTYLLTLDKSEVTEQPRVVSETVRCDGRLILEFTNGTVQLYNDEFARTFDYPFDSNRSALETISERKDNGLLTRFKTWLAGIHCFRINPYAMRPETTGKERYPAVNFSNFASWYLNFSNEDPRKEALRQSLKECMSAFLLMGCVLVGESVWILKAIFNWIGQKNPSFSLSELSEGQRCLICLYAIRHFLVAAGNTVIIDEPDNFVSLREIQPWLTSVSDAVEDGNGQVLLISHHPEIIDQWASGGGVRFVREEGMNGAHIEPFLGNTESSLPPSELVARGWER